MQNTSRINTILLIILIVLVVIGIWAITNRKDSSVDIKTNTQPQTQEKTTNYISEKDSLEWISSTILNLKYPKGIDVYEIREPYAEARFNFDGAIISWGGKDSECMEDDAYGEFEYGISVITCLKGNTARIGLENVRNIISQKALNMFSDFILINR